MEQRTIPVGIHLQDSCPRERAGAGFNGAQILSTLISTYVPTSQICRRLLLFYAGRADLRAIESRLRALGYPLFNWERIRILSRKT